MIAVPRIFGVLLVLGVLAAPLAGEAQQAKPYRIGVVFLPDDDEHATPMDAECLEPPASVDAHRRADVRGRCGAGHRRNGNGARCEALKKKYWLARPYLWVKGEPAGAFRVQLAE